MRISDWSSDVCSSDLPIARGLVQIAHLGIGVGEDDPGLVRIGAALRVPCVDQLGPRSLARLGRVDHAVLLIGMDRLAGAARRQRPRGVALPVLMLPANLVDLRSEEHTSELHSLMRNSYAVFCLKKKKYVIILPL